MTPEQQRIAIAQACGWTECLSDMSGTDPRGNVAIRLPEYLNDLNAMHEAEKVLDYLQREKYAEALYRVIPESITASYEGEHDYDGYYSLLHATAAQRAEAFLRTLNLWTE